MAEEQEPQTDEDYYVDTWPVTEGDKFRLSLKLPITIAQYEIGDVTADVTIAALPNEDALDVLSRLQDITITHLFESADRYVESMKAWRASRGKLVKKSKEGNE